MIRILYLSYNSVMTSGILQSQVATLLHLMAQKYQDKLSITLITAEKWKDYTNKKLKDSFLNQMLSDNSKGNIKIIIIPKFLPPQLYSTKPLKTLFENILLQLIFAFDMSLFTITTFWVIIRNNIQIIHARSYVPGLVGLFLKKITGIRLIFDPRGLIPEELQLTQKWSFTDKRYLKWKKLEKKLLEKSDSLLVLSEPFSKHYREIVPSLTPIIIPCCVNTISFKYDISKRLAYRTRYLFTDNFIVLYIMGHFVPYQDFDAALDIFNQIHKKISKSHFLIITPDIASLEKYLQKTKTNPDLYTIISLPYLEMPEHIMMSDLGLLVRIPSIITKVSSPVKFAEYLACGVPVLTQPEIGDTTKFIQIDNIGRIIESNYLSEKDFGWINQLQNLEKRDIIARTCTNTAERYFDWQNYLERYFELYSSFQKP